MAHDPIPTKVPEKVRAGDTWRWDRRLPDHPHTDGWSLSYAFSGANTLVVDAEAGDADDLYEVRVAASKTKLLTPGGYLWAEYIKRTVDGAQERYTNASGGLVVQPDLASVQDGRSHAERMLAVLEEALEAQDGSLISVSINGRSVTYDRSIAKRELGAYRAQVWQERNPGKIGPRVAARFVETSG